MWRIKPRAFLKMAGDVRFQRRLVAQWFNSLTLQTKEKVAHLSDAPRRGLVVTGDSARIQDETNESSAWFFNLLGV